MLTPITALPSPQQVGMESIIALQNEQAEALVLFEESMSNISAMLKVRSLHRVCIWSAVCGWR